ncbi:polymorphic toxin type 15 domain-containing protein [Agrococcus sp. SGAir0287]|uniref:polymorphic toxin type 15 domain-containing protein n=1 Tax=Agrococcus sp. SGAir0287 TaxID=2070347 RepID=UPI0010CD29FD|nr:polymorphic toxin type 15 domain-containing protein [Agrococcus sp. SGAir0287]QCR20493.1 hypothetical protein C1N71_14465 [Agrococcus sp. SGAir0287]
MGQIFRPVADIVTTTIPRVMRAGGDAVGDLSKKFGTKVDLDVAAIRGIDKFDKYTMTPTRRRREDARGDDAVTQDALDAEFDRQLDEQLAALGRIDLATWRAAMDGNRTRPPGSIAEQRRILDQANESAEIRADLIERGLDPDFVAATHRLDGIAGGDWLDISGVGDRSINSSLGSQWRARIPQLTAAVDAFADLHPDVDLGSVNMDIFIPFLR